MLPLNSILSLYSDSNSGDDRRMRIYHRSDSYVPARFFPPDYHFRTTYNHKYRSNSKHSYVIIIHEIL